MTERHGSGPGDEESGQRPSGRGAVTERLARRDEEAREVDLTDEASQRDQEPPEVDRTDEATRRDEHDEPAVDRESAGAFEPVAAGDPPAGATKLGSASIFDLGQRAKDEDRDRTGYEPAVAETGPAEPRGATVVTDPGEPRADTADDGPAGNATAEPAEDDGPGVTPADVGPAPVSDPPAAVGAGSGEAGTPASLLGSLDAADIRNRFLDIQAGFVDEPRQAVEEAGRFVDDLVQQVIDALKGQRGQLGAAVDDASTEDLRLALRAYRQFVDRLLGLAG